VDVAKVNFSQAYDVVHAHYGHAGVVARLQLRAPLVVSYFGDDLLGTRSSSGRITPRSRLEVTVFRELSRVSSATITKSAEMERVLPPRCRRRNHVIPSGVDLEHFSRLPRADARRQLGWDNGPVILFAGNPSVVAKNYPLAREVERRVAVAVPAVRMHVASGDVTHNHMPLLMSAADVLLVTSRSEGSPNVVKEAMATELPIVTTPVGDVEMRLEGLAGCYVRPPKADQLAEAVLAALGHGRVPEARAAVAALSLEAVARRILAVYDSVTPGPPSL
jgi:glycosyltransferase involved in cell wall biosynthesis